MTQKPFLSQIFEATGVRPKTAMEQSVDVLRRGSVILFRDPAFADYATRAPEAGIVSSIFYSKQGDARVPRVLTVCPLTKQSKDNFTPNTDNFWVIDREADVKDMKLNPAFNYRLGLGLIVRPGLLRTDVQRVIPMADAVLNPGKPDTALLLGEAPQSLRIRMETHLERRFTANPEAAKQLIYDVQRAFANRDNLSSFHKIPKRECLRAAEVFPSFLLLLNWA